jgi:hypothetical protein
MSGIALHGLGWQDGYRAGVKSVRTPAAEPAQRAEGGIMDDLTGTATQRMAQLRAADPAQRDADWLERQLVSALQSWSGTEDELREIREAREDF